MGGACVDVCPDLVDIPEERNTPPPPRRAFGRSVAVVGDRVAVADLGHVAIFAVDTQGGVVLEQTEFSAFGQDITTMAFAGGDVDRVVWSTITPTFERSVPDQALVPCTADSECTAPNTCIESFCRGSVGDVVIAELP